jgi:mannose-6-phosphate isomerase-like protein (cupin superfamily)
MDAVNIDGALTLQLRTGDVSPGPGELFVVPRGTEHWGRPARGQPAVHVG